MSFICMLIQINKHTKKQEVWNNQECLNLDYIFMILKSYCYVFRYGSETRFYFLDTYSEIILDKNDMIPGIHFQVIQC